MVNSQKLLLCVGIRGNQRADAAAKAALSSLLSNTMSGLPLIYIRMWLSIARDHGSPSGMDVPYIQ